MYTKFTAGKEELELFFETVFQLSADLDDDHIEYLMHLFCINYPADWASYESNFDAFKQLRKRAERYVNKRSVSEKRIKMKPNDFLLLMNLFGRTNRELERYFTDIDGTDDLKALMCAYLHFNETIERDGWK